MLPIARRIDDLFDRDFDLLVVGGGIAGACAAWDASLRGLRVGLIDAGDFASGASSNSLKLLHGGLRYVKLLLLREARDAVRERRAWLRIAPHLAQPIPIFIPTYAASLQNPAFVALLLAISDTVARDRNRGVPADRAIERSRLVSRAEVRALVPDLALAAAAGGAVFHDAQIHNTERLVLEVVRAAAAAGAVVANYVSFDGGILQRGVVTGARVTDRISGVSAPLRARAILNTAGADAPAVMRRILGSRPIVRPTYSLALNLMIRPTGLPVAVALTAGRGGGGRQILRVPWRDRELVGTYHRAPVEPSSRPDVLESDIAAFIAEANSASPELRLRREDILAVHAGTLPNAPVGRGHAQLLRRHRIIDHAGHGARAALSLLSVKYTTARLAAEEAVDLVEQRLGREPTPCATAHQCLPSAPADLPELRRAAVTRFGALLPADVVDHLVTTYGTGYEHVITAHQDVPGWNERLHAGSPVITAELLHGIHCDAAQTPDDLLMRRTELGARGVFDPEVRERIEALMQRARFTRLA